MQTRIALALASLSLVVSLLALTTVGGASNRRVALANSTGAHALVKAFNKGGKLTRNQGFKSVTHATTGIYCLALKDSTFASSQIATVAAELGNGSAVDAPIAVWDATNQNCPAGQIEVVAYDDDDPSDDVAFTVLVS